MDNDEVDNTYCTSEDLDGHIDLFGWKFVAGGDNGLVNIYLEDDEVYHLHMTFSTFWLDEFLAMAKILVDHPKRATQSS